MGCVGEWFVNSIFSNQCIPSFYILYLSASQNVKIFLFLNQIVLLIEGYENGAYSSPGELDAELGNGAATPVDGKPGENWPLFRLNV